MASHAAVILPQWVAPTRFPQGLNVYPKESAKGKLSLGWDPYVWNVFFDDFNGNAGVNTAAITSGASGIWDQLHSTSANGQTGAPTAGPGGLYLLTGSAGATDDMEMTTLATTAQMFQWNPNKKLYAEVRLSLDSATLGELSFGLVPTATTTLAASMTDGFRIAKTSAVGTFDFKTFHGSSTAKSTTSTLFNSTKMVAASTMMTMGFAYNGRFFQPNSPLPGTDNLGTAQNAAVTYGIVPYIVQGLAYAGLGANGSTTHTRDVMYQQTIALPATSLPTTTVNLMPCIGYINTSGVSRIVTLDYVFIAQER